MNRPTKQEKRTAEQAAGLIRCPQCGGEVQVTIKAYMSADARDGQLAPGFGSHYTSEDAQVYCASDHKLDDVFEVVGDEDDTGPLRVQRRRA